MKHRLFILLLLYLPLFSCGPITEVALTSHPSEAPLLATAIPSETSTATLEPTATIGYQATAIEAQAAASTAQAEADAANRLLVDATSQEKDRLQEQTRWTAEAAQQAFQIYVWTATAAPTSVPATQTQAVLDRSAAATEYSIIGISLDMTRQAPTQIVQMAQAENEAKFMPIRILIELFGLFSVGCFVLALAYWLMRLAVRYEQEPIEVQKEPAIPVEAVQTYAEYDMPLGTLVTLKQNNSGYVALSRMLIPCTPVQLSELAERALKGESLAVNRFEGMETTWTRADFYRMRGFMRDHGFVHSSGQAGQVALTEDGKAFLRGWLNKNALPRGIEFAPKDGMIAENMSHTYENHGDSSGGGVGFDVPNPLDKGTLELIEQANRGQKG